MKTVIVYHMEDTPDLENGPSYTIDPVEDGRFASQIEADIWISSQEYPKMYSTLEEVFCQKCNGVGCMTCYDCGDEYDEDGNYLSLQERAEANQRLKDQLKEEIRIKEIEDDQKGDL
jgi:hypothetical protein